MSYGSDTSSEEVMNLYKKLVRQQEQITSALRELTSKITTTTLLQICRDQKRDLKVIEDLSEIIDKYLDSTKKTFQMEAQSIVRELEEIDRELNKNLAGVFAVILEFLNKIRKIKGIDTSLGIARIETLVDEMLKSLKDSIKTRREVIENISREIENEVQEILREKEAQVENLSDYSIRNVFGRTIIVGVPIIKVTLGSSESYAVLGNGLVQYERRILDSVRSYSFGVNNEILARALQAIRSRKGFLYNIFLDYVVKLR